MSDADLRYSIIHTASSVVFKSFYSLYHGRFSHSDAISRGYQQILRARDALYEWTGSLLFLGMMISLFLFQLSEQSPAHLLFPFLASCGVQSIQSQPGIRCSWQNVKAHCLSHTRYWPFQWQSDLIRFLATVVILDLDKPRGRRLQLVAGCSSECQSFLLLLFPRTCFATAWPVLVSE